MDKIKMIALISSKSKNLNIVRIDMIFYQVHPVNLVKSFSDKLDV